MLKTTSVIVLAAASLVGISSAFADAGAKSSSSFTPSFFADVELGYANSNLRAPEEAKQFLKQSGIAGGADLGYQFAPNFGVDAGFLYFSNVSAKIMGFSTTLAKYNYVANLALRVIAPIQKFDIYGEIGPGLGHISYVGGDDMPTVATTKAVLFGAIGADYHFTDMISLGVKGVGTTAAGTVNTTSYVPRHLAVLADLGVHFSA